MPDNVLRLRVTATGAGEATREFNQLGAAADRAADQGQRLERQSAALSGALRGLAVGAAAAIAAFATREVLQIADAFQRVDQQLRLSVTSTAELAAAQEALFGVAQRSFTRLNSTVDLFSRIARSSTELGLDQSELVGITETISQLVTISGSSARSAQAALVQLGQGLASGTLRGEELNSVLEQTPALARAIAAGLGVSLGQLHQLGQDRALTAERIIAALQQQGAATQAVFDQLQPTIGQVGIVINNAFQRGLVSQFNDELNETSARVLELEDVFAGIGAAIGAVFNLALQGVNALLGGINSLRLAADRFTLPGIGGAIDETSQRAVNARLSDLANQIGEIERRQEDRSVFGGDVGPRAERESALLTTLLAEFERLSLLNQADPSATVLPTVRESDPEFAALVAQLQTANSEQERAARSASEFARAQRQANDQARLAGDIAQGRIDQAVQDEASRGSQATFEALRARLSAIADIFRDASPEVRQEVNTRLVQALEDFPEAARAAVREGSEQGVSDGFSSGRFLQSITISADTITEISDAISGGLTQVGDVLADANASALQRIEGIARGFGQSARGLGDGLSSFGARIGGDLGGALSQISQVLGSLGAIGQTVGALIQVGRAIADLFRPRSSAATFSPDGDVSFVRTSRTDERNALRDQVGASAISVAQQIAELTGGEFAEGVGIRIFIDRNDELLATLRDLQTNAIIATPTGFVRDDRGITDDPDVAIRQGVNLLVANSLEGGDERLVAFARAAAQADIETEDLIEGLNSLQRVFDLTTEPLSQIEEQLRAIDEAVAPAIEALQSVGQSIQGITDIANQAARAVGERFIEDVQDQIVSEQNSTLGQYRQLLSAIEARQRDALALLERGAISQGEFESVQFLGALQTRNFFQGLSSEDLQNLGDFFGLLGDEVGDAAVALARLEIEISNFADNAIETADRLESEIRAIDSAVNEATAARSDILRQFSGDLPQENIASLSSELRAILGEVSNPTTSGERIAEQVSLAAQIARDIIDQASQTFGPTATFGAIRDTTTSLLSDIIGAGQDRSAERATELETLQTQVRLLEEIRDQLASSETSLPFIQESLASGEVSNALLRELLEAYVAASNVQQAALDPSVIQQRADTFLAASQQSFSLAAGDISSAIFRADQSRQTSDSQIISSLSRLTSLQEQSNADQRELLDRLRLSA